MFDGIMDEVRFAPDSQMRISAPKREVRARALSLCSDSNNLAVCRATHMLHRNASETIPRICTLLQTGSII